MNVINFGPYESSVFWFWQLYSLVHEMQLTLNFQSHQSFMELNVVSPSLLTGLLPVGVWICSKGSSPQGTVPKP